MAELFCNLREEMQFARTNNHQWRWFFIFWDAGKALLAIAATAVFVFAIGHILYGYQLPASFASTLTGEPPRVADRTAGSQPIEILPEVARVPQKEGAARHLIHPEKENQHTGTLVTGEPFKRIDSQVAAIIIESSTSEIDAPIAANTNLSIMISRLSSRMIEFDNGFLAKPMEASSSQLPSREALVLFTAGNASK